VNKVGVLDHGHVHLVDHMGSDLTVVNAARVSFANESKWEAYAENPQRSFELKLKEKDEKLIRYLAKHNHWTPFAHPQITLRIKAPISIRTQFFKHKQGFVENEISRRYVSFLPEFYHPEWRSKPEGNAKQGSDEKIPWCMERDSWDYFLDNLYDDALHLYETMINEGVAPEQARFVLPQAMYTEWYWTGSLAAYGRFYKQRIDEHAQWEIQQYAEAVGKIIEPFFPVSWNELTT